MHTVASGASAILIVGGRVGRAEHHSSLCVLRDFEVCQNSLPKAALCISTTTKEIFIETATWAVPRGRQSAAAIHARTLASPSCVLHAEDCADDEEEHARPQDEGDVGAREVVVRLDDGGGRLRGGSGLLGQHPEEDGGVHNISLSLSTRERCLSINGYRMQG